MNKHGLIALLVGYCSLLFSTQSTACGYDWISDCSAQVQLQINGVSDSFKITGCPSGYSFDGLSVGGVQSISLVNAKAITWESCQNNVAGVQFKYRVYEQGFPNGNWLVLDLQEDFNTLDGPYTTRYRSHPTSISLSSGLTVGKTYTIEVYFEAAVDTIGDDFIPETVLLQNNSGQNYRLNFTYGGASAPPLLIVPHSTPPKCHGSSDGKISISTYGDLGGLLFQWSNTPLNFYQQNGLAAGSYGITVTNSAGDSAQTSIQLEAPQPLTTSFINIQAAGCNNSPGSATAMGNGGTPPYQYLWQNGVQTDSVILAFSGEWQLTVTDANDCSTTDTVLIGDDGLVERNLSAEICSGSTYTISGQSFSAAGNYTFNTPGTNGCDTITYLAINVLAPEALFATIPDSVSITCASPQITLCASAHPSASYQWLMDSIPVGTDSCLTATAGGIYMLHVMLNGCSAIKNIALEEHLAAAPAQISGEFIFFCNGIQPSWLVAHTSAENPAYAWVYNGAVISTSDSCFFQITEFLGVDPILPSLSITDQYSCVNSMPIQNIIFTQYPALLVQPASIVPASSSTASDGAISISILGGNPPYAIDWSNGATTPNISGLAPDTYCVTVTDSHGCFVTTCATVSFATAVNTTAHQPLQITPNPVASGQWVQISIPETQPGAPIAIEVVDLLGRVYFQERIAATSFGTIPIKIPVELKPGVVLLRLYYRGAVFLGLISVQ